MAAWNALPTERQEKIIGRTRVSDIELDCNTSLATRQHAFGNVDQKEFGTYFIDYSKSPGTIEERLQNTFVGKPPGTHDRTLEFSRAVTGNLFFAPSATFLDNVA